MSYTDATLSRLTSGLRAQDSGPAEENEDAGIDE